MTEHDPIHELLPWFVTRTLEGAEHERFRAHLASCAECREELEVLKRIRDAAAEHGRAFFSEHPGAERLVAAVRGELDPTDVAEIRRHIALCATCAAESRWVAGERVAGSGAEAVAERAPAAPASAARRWWPLAAAAALIAVAALVLVPRGPARYSGPAAGHFLAPTERGGDAPTRIPRPARGRPLLLAIEVDYPNRAFPVETRILDADGREVYAGAARLEDLTDDLYLYLLIDPDTLSAGIHTVEVRPADAGVLPIETRFELGE